MSETLLSTARAQLTNERVSLRRQLAELTGLDLDHNFADSSQVAAEQGEVRILADSLRSVLVEVEQALEKLDAGTYGACEKCGDPIAEARLEAMPATKWCVKHA